MLDALEGQSDRAFEVAIVDQSDEVPPAVHDRVAASPAAHLIVDDGRGLARARNVGWRHVGSQWVAFLDDDTVPDPDWAACLREELQKHPEVDMVTGEVAADGPEQSDYPSLGAFVVGTPRVIEGRWIRPWRVAGGIATIKRSTIAQLGGWDERFGAGTPDFPGSEDMDFNYRLTRSGGRVWLTPRVRVSHVQWREADDAAAVYAAYNRSWGGLVMKLFKTGDPAGAALFTAGRLRGIWKVARAGVARRSRRRLTLAGAELRGFMAGLLVGLRRSW